MSNPTRCLTSPPATPRPAPPRAALCWASLAGLGWAWAVGLSATRGHDLVHYLVYFSAPRVWGLLALDGWKLLVMLAAGTGLAVGCVRAARKTGQALPAATRWLLAALAVPVMDLLRAAAGPVANEPLTRFHGVAPPDTLLEPLWLSWVTGKAVVEVMLPAGDDVRRLRRGTPGQWLAGVWLLAAAAGLWWYLEGVRAYDDYMLGYHDFGHFAYRVARTWEGRGFLNETPVLPAFWDHFNPGLALLAPLWGLWPDARLFILLQAICLALPAPLVFGIARRSRGLWMSNASGWRALHASQTDGGDVSPGTAALWAVAYLAYPAVGQLNLGYSYGWHPVSMALPLFFFSVWALLKRRPVVALLSLFLGCSFEETLLVTPAGLAATGAAYGWWSRRRARQTPATPCSGSLDLLGVRSAWWLALAATLGAAFVVIFQYAGFAEFQAARFSNLGRTTAEIAFSPVLRPRAFWGQVLRLNSLLFLAALLVPLGVRNVLRGWSVLLAVVLPVGVLLAWKHIPATSICFQYVTTLLPVLFLAALAGASGSASGERAILPIPIGQAGKRADPPSDASPAIDQRLWAAGLSALGASLTASFFFGTLPWSATTEAVVVARSYPITMAKDFRPRDAREAKNPRAKGTRGNAMLEEITAEIVRSQASVLATGRVAAHLLRAPRLESVEQGTVRWDALRRLAGEDRSPIELFDWVVLDRWEQLQQSEDKSAFFLREARQAGYQTVTDAHGLLALERPGRGGGRR